MASLMRFTADGESGMGDTPLFFRRAAAWVQLGFGSRGHVARPNSAAQIFDLILLLDGYGDLKILHSRFASNCLEDADGGQVAGEQELVRIGSRDQKM
jgi:hypothetical protein